MRKPTPIEDLAVGAALIALASWAALIIGAVRWWTGADDLNSLGDSE